MYVRADGAVSQSVRRVAMAHPRSWRSWTPATRTLVADAMVEWPCRPWCGLARRHGSLLADSRPEPMLEALPQRELNATSTARSPTAGPDPARRTAPDGADRLRRLGDSLPDRTQQPGGCPDLTDVAASSRARASANPVGPPRRSSAPCSASTCATDPPPPRPVARPPVR